MNQSPNLPTHTKISQLINISRLNEAISLLKNAFSKFPNLFQYRQKLMEIEKTYTYLLDYMVEGKEDPTRESMISELKSTLLFLNDILLLNSNMVDSPDSFSSNKRMDILKKRSFTELYSNYISLNEKVTEGEENRNSSLTPEHFNSLSLVFNHIWTIFDASEEEYSTIAEKLTDLQTPEEIKSMIISAILLGNTAYFDSNTFNILLEGYEKEQAPNIKARLIVAICLISLIHAERIALRIDLTSRLKLMAEDPEYKSLINFSLLEIINAYDTKRVTAKMRNEVIPGLMKINPEIIDKLRNLASDSEDFLSDSNPDWEEIIENSGVQDKIEEINKMQMDGSDVMMTTFANLKGFSFFREISNWFLPFYPEHPEISDTNSSIADMLSHLDIMMCDSDIYSFLLSIKSLPDSRKEMMLKNMQQQIGQLEEIMASSVNDSSKTLMERLIRHYIRDIYRFFNLYSRKQDFNDPFMNPINPNNLKSLVDFMGIETDTVLKAAEFYFKYGYYEVAAPLFELTDSLEPGDFVVWEKVGYCLDKCAKYSQAIEWYKKAELFDSGSKWLDKKLAITLKNVGNYKEALQYYDRILGKEPENYHILMSAGQCHLEAEEYEKALQHFYHAEYLKPERKDAKRAIAWTLLLMKDFEKSSNMYVRLTDDQTADNSDFLNAALCSMANSVFPAAIKYYSIYLDKTGNDFRGLQIALRDDSATIKKLGISSQNLRLIIDKLRYDKLANL